MSDIDQDFRFRHLLILDADGVVSTMTATNVAIEGAIEVDEATYLSLLPKVNRVRWVDGQAIDLPEPPTPALPIRVYKAPMFRKMTDAEYEAYLQIRVGFLPRLQAIFDAAEYLSSDDEFWPALVAAAEQAYGPDRAAEILAPEA
jgi:hypothetical protein